MTTPKNETAWLWVHRIGMPILMFILTLAVTIGGFIGGKIWNSVDEGFRVHNSRIHALELRAAESSGNRFTSTDWTMSRQKLDEERNLLDQRITRVEAAVLNFEKSLTRIERGIERLEKRSE